MNMEAIDAIEVGKEILRGILLEEAEARGLGKPWFSLSASLMEQPHPITDQITHQPVVTLIAWFEGLEEGSEMVFLPPAVIGVLALMDREQLSSLIRETVDQAFPANILD